MDRLPSPRPRPLARGFTHVEAMMAMGLMSLLAAVGMTSVQAGRPSLQMLAREFEGSVSEAFLLARARGRSVILSLGATADPDILPVRLPPGVRWGKPSAVPLPLGMADPTRADDTGSSHARITVTPWHTTAASAWFATDGHDVVCLRLSGRGHLQVLRWREHTGKWSRE